MKEYVAYEGPCFTVEWFYDENGVSQSLEYFNGLSDVQKRKVLMLFKRIGDSGKISDITKFRNEGDTLSFILLCWEKDYCDKCFLQEVSETS